MSLDLDSARIKRDAMNLHNHKVNLFVIEYYKLLIEKRVLAYVSYNKYENFIFIANSTLGGKAPVQFQCHNIGDTMQLKAIAR